MGLIDQIKSDIEDITSNAEEFGWPLIFTSLDGISTVNVTGLYTKHHIQIDPESGKQINVKNAHCSVSEKFFRDASYPCRDANNEVAMKRHKVRTTDVSGITWDYVVQENHADETTGLIVFILGDFQQSS